MLNQISKFTNSTFWGGGMGGTCMTGRSKAVVFITMIVVEQIIGPHEIPGCLSNAYFIVYNEDIRSVLECGYVTLSDPSQGDGTSGHGSLTF